jgi:hypothetical protein
VLASANVSRIALHGIVKATLVDADTADRPVTGNHVALAATYPSFIGSSKEYSTVNVADPVKTAPNPILKGFEK